MGRQPPHWSGLALLAGRALTARHFAARAIDSWEEVLVEEVLARRGVRYESQRPSIRPFRGRMIFTTYEKIPVTLFNSASTRGGWINAEEIAAFLAACETFLRKNRPYDNADQLLSVNNSPSQPYTPNGNRNNTGNIVGAGNRLLFDASTNYYYSYDAEGNRTSQYKLQSGQPGRRDDYTWDSRDRLTSVTTPSGTVTYTV